MRGSPMGTERSILAVCRGYLTRSYQPLAAREKRAGVGEAVLHPGHSKREKCVGRGAQMEVDGVTQVLSGP